MSIMLSGNEGISTNFNLAEHTSFADDAWIVALVEYVKKVLTTTKIPVVGICFGHQIIGRALGAKVGVSPGGWEISVDKIDLSEEGQKLLGVPSLVRHEISHSGQCFAHKNLRVFTRCIAMRS
jgi:GMP synthase-like glutamine amidotransferase